MPPTSLTIPAFALLAFLVAFYTLLARERKTPYITNFIYPVATLIVLAILFSSVSPLFHGRFPGGEIALNWAAFSLLCAGLLLAFHSVWRLQNRHVHFRDDHLIQNLSVYRKPKYFFKRLRNKPSYEHNAPEDLNLATVVNALSRDNNPFILEVATALNTSHEKATNSLSLAICGRRLIDTDALILKLIERLVAQDWYVQYTTCIRHPFELVAKLQTIPGLKDQSKLSRIAVVDAYTPHFGFTDSIHLKLTSKIQEEGLHIVTSSPSYAGVHTATAKAFNKLKSAAGRKVRRPTLVIYEGCNALVDLESSEQYRIFIRHVLPSERAWGGMLTLFIEPTIPGSDTTLLETYSDAFVGAPKRDQHPGSEAGGTNA